MKLYDFYLEWLEETHLLIAGATGSGKSVIINGLITTLCASKTSYMILIDPKRVELIDYANMAHCLRHVTEPRDIIDTLNYAITIMEDRYREMARQGIKKYEGYPLWIFIDEYADLITTSRKLVEPLIIRLAQLGRAAAVHLCIATQRPTKDIITGTIKVNLDSRIALRVPTNQDSRNIINASGAEDLPMYGECLYISPKHKGLRHLKVPMYTDEERHFVIDHYRREEEYKPKISLWKRIKALI